MKQANSHSQSLILAWFTMLILIINSKCQVRCSGINLHSSSLNIWKDHGVCFVQWKHKLLFTQWIKWQSNVMWAQFYLCNTDIYHTTPRLRAAALPILLLAFIIIQGSFLFLHQPLCVLVTVTFKRRHVPIKVMLLKKEPYRFHISTVHDRLEQSNADNLFQATKLQRKRTLLQSHFI